RYLSRDPRREDVLSVYVGLRPLVRHEGATRTASLSRDHSIFESESGLVTIVGGKWTTYRRMGQDVVDHAARLAGLPRRPSPTAGVEPDGGPLGGHGEHSPAGAPSERRPGHGAAPGAGRRPPRP